MRERGLFYFSFLLIYLFIFTPQVFATEITGKDTYDSADDLVNEESNNLVEQSEIETQDTELDNKIESDNVIPKDVIVNTEGETEQQAELESIEATESANDSEPGDGSAEPEVLSENVQKDEQNQDLVKENEPAELLLHNGVRHESVIQLKKELEKLGFVSWKNEPNNYFGDSTEKAVLDFQVYYGLNQTGIADTPVLHKIEEMLAIPFQNGKIHEGTVKVKQDLAVLGYVKWNNVPNDYFGKQTEIAIIKFQRDNSLPASGIVDPTTMTKLVELAEAPLQLGMYRSDAVHVKKNLARLGFIKWKNEPNDYFGASSEKALKDFQRYYGIKQTGILDNVTITKMDSVLSNPLQNGKRQPDTIQLKRDLERLGYVNWKNNPNDYFGAGTEQAVQAFQRDYSLPISGIAEEVTFNKIIEVLNIPYQTGKRDPLNVQLKKDLEKLGFINWKNNPNDYFGSSTKNAVIRFQKHFGLRVNGIADKFTLAKIDSIKNSPMQNGRSNSDVKRLKRDLELLGYVDWKNPPNNFFGKSTENVVKKFQKENGLPISGIVDEITLKAINKESKGIVKVFLDPGHGGKDPGGQGYGLKEKDLVLDIALKTASVLSSKYVGVDVMLSRTTDTFIELTDRSKMANNWDADYFVSFHTNAFLGLSKGFETYIYNGKVTNEEKSRQADIHNYLAKRINVNDRGMKDANFNVLRNTNMPAILLEYMYIDNKTENRLLGSKSYRNYLGLITADAIANAYGLKRR
ncbi:peptidoglycan-binding protein [Paucisalibacillus sp. EB02]|uniref:peptidoglycan-binding protein n=1 Tax=Paucisalibacillus sp. EB02 TaxID=1347087 RepID=UPI0004B99D39|nr:peptidoglycan-binding protein [Paucisalibacillus sp. EB02]